jgi:hypothetical protein
VRIFLDKVGSGMCEIEGKEIITTTFVLCNVGNSHVHIFHSIHLINTNEYLNM